MLDKIIQKIKNLIPQKKGAEEKKVESTAPAAATPVSSDEEAKKKKKAMIIKIVAGVVVLYVAIDEFILKKETPPEQEQVQVTDRKRTERKPKKSLKDNQKEEAPSREVSSVPDEKIPEVEKKAPTAEVPAEAIVEQPIVSETPTPAPVEESIEEPKTTDETAAPVSTESPPEEMTIAAVPEQPVSPDTSPKESTESPTEEVAKEMEKVAEQIGPIPEEEIKPAEKVELPDYTIKGRGLVYNCLGKHWACIDKEGYLSCREHMKWSEENKKSPECVVKNVYNAEEDCAVIQLHYVNTNESTSFCK